MNKHYSSRIRLVSIFILFFSLVLVGKLYLIQIVYNDVYKEKADRQYIKVNSISYDRGSIFFENKNGNAVKMATLKTGFTLSINPKMIKDSNLAFNSISKIISLDKNSFLTKASKKKDPYEEIAKKISIENGKEIENLKIPGVLVISDKWRYYPGDTSAAHLLGFVGYNGDKLEGRYGLEKYYNDLLERDNSKVNINFFAEIFSGISKTFFKGKSFEGNLVTTIEPTVQVFLEKILQDFYLKWNPDIGGGVIINPKNGEIYAMAAIPTFNLNQYNLEKNQRIFVNPIVENVYEMGSVVKPLTVAAGIDSGVITAKSTYYDEGFLKINNKTIYNFDKKGRGFVNMQEVLNQSLNTGAAYISKKIGKDEFVKYMLDFGIGEKTRIDLPNEAVGLVSNLLSKQDIAIATAAYGQGIAMTPIAMVRALSILANGGNLINPHLAKKIEYRIGPTKILSYENEKKVLKENVTEEVSRMLVETADKILLKGETKIGNISVAAKTGTAQIAKEDGGGYYEDKYLHSFFGYFPAYNPKFLIFLYAKNPKGVKYASQSLASPFADIAKFLINYYEIPPDR